MPCLEALLGLQKGDKENRTRIYTQGHVYRVPELKDMSL